MKPKTVALTLIATHIVTSTASAHPTHGSIASDALSSGFLHPWLGMDHLLAMFAVGLLAVQFGGRALWILPLSFLGSMITGGVIGIASWNVSFVEFGIAASVLVLGVAIAAGRRFPLVTTAVVIALFGIFHGHAHGTEIPATAALFLYFTGFVSGTALLHMLGIGLGLIAARSNRWQSAIRFSGAAVAGVGLLLLLGMA